MFVIIYYLDGKRIDLCIINMNVSTKGAIDKIFRILIVFVELEANLLSERTQKSGGYKSNRAKRRAQSLLPVQKIEVKFL